MTLRIDILGPAEISHDERPLSLPGYRPLALLVYLLITGKPQSRQHLVNLLFEQPDDPRGALRWTLSQLRKNLGPDAIHADRQEISFNFECDHWLDVTAFEAGATDLYRGELLEGIYLRNARLYNTWLLVERERLRAHYQAGMEQRLQEQLEAEDAEALEQTAQRLLELDNSREDWHRALLNAYARQDKYSAARAQYQLCSQILLEELDAAPAPETAALAAAIEKEQAGHSVLAARSAARDSEFTAAPIEGQQMAEQQEVLPADPGGSRASQRTWLQRIGIVGGVSLVILFIILALRVFSNEEANSGLATVGDRQDGQPTTNELAGTTVTIVGPINSEVLRLFQKSLIPFEQETGINNEVGMFPDDFEQIVPSLVDSGLAPDIVQFPQPGLLAEFVRKGQVVDVRTFLDDAYLQQQYGQALLEATMIEGQMAGVWHKSNLKSLVWYSKEAFDEAGYEIPQTWEELLELSDQIVADGGTPWCIGIESGVSSGWVGTDWMEDILLRTAPPETYDAWVAGGLPFDSPEIRRVFAIMEDIWLDDAYVYGGTETISSELFFENALHLFERPPGCLLHKQSSFILDFFPEDAAYGQQYDFFYLPPIDAELGRPVLGGGDIMAMFNDRPEVREVIRFLTTAESVKYLVEDGGIISPHRDAPFEWYSSPAQLKMAQIILDADTVRFDGSDLMPAEVGTGTFWQGIIAWLDGGDLDSVLEGIDDSWPGEE